jgi:hypothetical protein
MSVKSFTKFEVTGTHTLQIFPQNIARKSFFLWVIPFSKQREKGYKGITYSRMSPGQCSHLLDTEAGSRQTEQL